MLKKLRLAFLGLLLVFLYACGGGDTPVVHYDFNNSIDIDVFSEQQTLDLVDLVVNDPNYQLDDKTMSYDLSSINFNVLGWYSFDFTYVDLNKKSVTIPISVHIVDRVNPVIVGLKNYTLNINSNMPDLLDGVTVTDNYDGNMTLTLFNFDTSEVHLDTVGEYHVRVSVRDSNNNEAVYSETIYVVDHTPTIDLEYIDDLSIPQFTTFDYSNLIENKQEFLDAGYTFQFDSSQLNTLGDQSLIISIKDGDETVLSDTLTVHVVLAVTAIFKEEADVALNSTITKEDYLESLTNYLGQPITLGSTYTIDVDKALSTSSLGTTDYVFMIKNGANQVLAQSTVHITVKNPYDIQFKSSLYVYHNAFNFDPLTLITCVKDIKGDTVQVPISTSNSIDVAQLGDQSLTYIIEDNNHNILYQETITVQVVNEFEFDFSDQTTIFYSLEMFDGSTLLDHIYGFDGHEVVLGSEFRLEITPVDPTTVGNQEITFVLLDNESHIRLVDTLTVTVVYVGIDFVSDLTTPYLSTFTPDLWINQYEDKEGNPISLASFGLSLNVIGSVDTTKVGTYDLIYQLVDRNDTIVYSHLVEGTVRYTVNFNVVNDLFVALYSTFNVADYIEGYYNIEGQVINLQDEGLSLNTIGTIDPTILGEQTLTMQLIDESDTIVYQTEVTFTVGYPYQFEMIDDLFVLYLSTFDSTHYIANVTDHHNNPINYEEANLIFEVQGSIDTSIMGTYHLNYRLTDALGNVYDEQESDFIVDTYTIALFDAPINYNQDDFSLSQLVEGVYNYYDEPVNLAQEGLTLNGVGTVDPSTTGAYELVYQLLNSEKEVLYEISFTVYVEYAYTIEFTSDFTVTYNQVFDPEDYILNYADIDGNAIDLTSEGLTLNVLGSVDSSQLKKQTLTYQIVNSNDQVLFTQTITFTVQYDYYFTYDSETICFFNEPCDGLDFITGIYTTDGELVNIESLGYTLHADLIDSTTLGTVDVTIQLLDESKNVVLSTILSMDVVYRYTPEFVSNIQIQMGDAFDLNDYLIQITDYHGEKVSNVHVNLLTEWMNRLGFQTVEYEIVDDLGNSYYIGCVDIQTISLYQMTFVPDLTIQMGTFDYDLYSFIDVIVDPDGQPIDWMNYSVNAYGTVNPYLCGSNSVTYQLMYDETYQVVYETTIEIEVVSNYEIHFIDDLTYYLYDKSDFDYLYFVNSVTDLSGNLIQIEAPYSLEVDGEIDFYDSGYYKITYNLLEDTTIVSSYAITIHLILYYDIGVYESQPINVGVGELTPDFDLFPYIFLAGDYIIPWNEHFTYIVTTPVDPNVPMLTYLNIDLYFAGHYLLSFYQNVIIYDDTITVNVPPSITISATDPVSTLYNGVTVTNADGDIPILTCIDDTTFYDYGLCILVNSDILIAKKVQDKLTSSSYSTEIIFFVITPDNYYYGGQRAILNVVNPYIITYNSDNSVLQDDPNFDPLQLIESITALDGTPLIINQDVLVDVSGDLDISIASPHTILYTLKDLDGEILYSENWTYYVFPPIYGFDYVQTTINIDNDYSISDFILSVYSFNPITGLTVLPLEDLSIDIDVYFDDIGDYYVPIYIYDRDNNLIIDDEILIHFVSNVNIYFTEPIVTVNVDSTFEPMDYVNVLYDNGIDVTNSSYYTITASMVDTSYPGLYTVEYEVYDLDNYLLATEHLLVRVV